MQVQMNHGRTAALLGASGLVGGFCLRALADDAAYSRLILLGRRELARWKQAKVSQRVVADLASLTAEDFRGVQDVFIALGTTIRKAGSQAEFRRIDLEMPLHVAAEAAKAGAEQLVLVSAVGADAKSKNFYLRTKGELEQEIAKLPFKAFHILRPSLLIGKRAESRPGESIGLAMAPALNIFAMGPLRKYHGVSAEVVGRAMVGAAASGKTGTSIYEYDDLKRLGTQPPH
jgi:uncharacterized protein YbjT (DUF2867 family)